MKKVFMAGLALFSGAFVFGISQHAAAFPITGAMTAAPTKAVESSIVAVDWVYVHPTVRRVYTYHYVRPTVYVSPRYVRPTVYLSPRYVRPTVYLSPNYVRPTVELAPRYVRPTVYLSPRYVSPTVYTSPVVVQPVRPTYYVVGTTVASDW